MNFNKRQLQQKKKTEKYLQQLVDQANNRTTTSVAPQRTVQKKTAVKTTAVKPVAKKKTSPSVKKSVYKPAVKPVKKENTLAKFADTIENYRTKPMSKKKKKRRNAIYYFFISLIVIGLMICSLTIFFKLGSFEISGSTKYSDEKIIAASQIEYETNIFRIDKASAEAAIEEALPYVKDVTIKRELPSTLKLTITETKAQAAVQISSGYAIIDGESKILEQSLDNKGLPVIKGAVISNAVTPGTYAEYADENAAELISELVTALDEGGILSNIDSLNITKRYDIKFVCNDNITCVIGDSSDMDVKIGMIKVVLEKNPQSIKAVIDATDPNKVYYRPEN